MTAILAIALGSSFAIADIAPPPEQTISNKALVAEMFQKILVEKKLDEIDTYLAPDFIEHDPDSKDGAAAFKAEFTDYFKANPDAVMSVKRVIADGDLVLVHLYARAQPTDRGVVAVDIVRVARGKIVEHWGVTQPIPEKSANDNTMF